MGHETSIRLPARLLGLVRTDPASPPAAPHPLSAELSSRPEAPPEASAEPSAKVDSKRDQEQHIERVLAELSVAAEQLRTSAARSMAQIKTAAVDLAIAVASHFLMEQVRAGAYPFDRLVEQALDRLSPRQPVTIRLHPEDLASLHDRLGENPPPSAVDLRWTPDSSLQRGGCMLETPDRSLLFDMDERLVQLRQRLVQAAFDEAPTV